DVLGLFDHADHRPVAARILAHRAFGFLGDVSADLAEPHSLLHVGECLRQRIDVLRVRLQDVERQTLGRLRPDARELAELFDQVLEGTFVYSAHTSLSSMISPPRTRAITSTPICGASETSRSVSGSYSSSTDPD